MSLPAYFHKPRFDEFFLVLSGVDFAVAVGWSFVLAGTRRLRVLIEIN